MKCAWPPYGKRPSPSPAPPDRNNLLRILTEAVSKGVITPASAKNIIENTEYQEVLHPIVRGLLKEKK